MNPQIRYLTLTSLLRVMAWVANRYWVYFSDLVGMGTEFQMTMNFNCSLKRERGDPARNLKGLSGKN